jgi:hypothetical protein
MPEDRRSLWDLSKRRSRRNKQINSNEVKKNSSA